MIARIKAVIAAFLAAISAFFGCSEPIHPPQPTEEPDIYAELTDDEYYSSIFSPVLRFAITTDTHILDGYGEQQTRKLQMFYDAAYDYAAKADGRLDAILFAGDCTNAGSSGALNEFFRIARENTRGSTVVKAVMGNHEFYSGASTAEARFLKASGYSSTDNDLVIGGYHFIMLSPSSSANGGHYGSDKLKWLSEHLAAAAKEDPTGKKPIFMVNHIPPVGTVYTSDEEEAVHDFDAILAKYPQLVEFTGHTHSPANDPKSVWQGEYTVLNCGSMVYYGGGLAGICEKYVYPTDHNGGNNAFVPGNVALDDAGDYYIVEVDAHNAIKITGYNIYAEGSSCVYYLRYLGDPAKFRYTDNRVEKQQIPAFGNGDKLGISELDCSGVKIAIPQTKNEAFTQHYRLELYDASGERIDTAYVLSDRFYTPVPDVLYGGFYDLEPSTEYTVKCIAVSAYALESQPISVSFKTEECAEPEVTPMPVEPDVFMLKYSAGKYYDGVSSEPLTKVGRIGRSNGGAIFNGSSYLKYESFDNFYPTLKNGFSMEFYGSFSTFNNDKEYINMFANFEFGGIGFQCEHDGTVYCAAMSDGVYTRSSSGKIGLNSFVHLVETYDGRYLNFYLNGTLISSTDIGANLQFTENDAAKFLCIGGDSNADGGATCLFSGSIKGANVYAHALTQVEIDSLYGYYAG